MMAGKIKPKHPRVEYLVGYILRGERLAGSACFQSEVYLDFGRSIVRIRADYRLPYSGRGGGFMARVIPEEIIDKQKMWSGALGDGLGPTP